MVAKPTQLVMSMPGADQTKVQLPEVLPFSDSYVKETVLAMRTQGTWFMGRECRTEEQATKVTRDLLALLHVMGFKPPEAYQGGPLKPGWEPPV